jgi:GMP synthase PP-ATPase subunit
VGVQGDCRTYSNLVALSSVGAPNWTELLAMAKEVRPFSEIALKSCLQLT